MPAVGCGRIAKQRAHGDRTNPPGAFARDIWIRLLVVALAMAWVSGVEATEPGGSAPFAVGSVQHVSHAAPDVDSNTAPEPAQGAAGVFEATPPLASVGAR
jgi:hypothetical protein